VDGIILEAGNGFVARVKIAYVGGGSTRAPGTMASFVDHGEDFAGSEIFLVDLDADRLAVVQRLAERMASSRGADLTVRATTDRREGLEDCDLVLTSFRPGGFEARVVDERIPLKHGILGEETQGPGGFFMALRSIHVMQEIAEDMEAVCPRAWVFNYTNPINIVAEALTHHTDIPVVSLCEGPIYFPRRLADVADLDPDLVHATMVGLNHASWSVRHTYDGEELMPLVEAAYARREGDPATPRDELRLLELAATMGAIPAEYLTHYYFSEEVVAELAAKPTTRAEDILAALPSYWAHYEQEARADMPALDPSRSRDGIGELELAVDVMGAMLNGRDDVFPVNLPNNGALPQFPADLVVEVPGRVTSTGIEPISQPPLPRHLLGLLEMLGEYQAITAEAAWRGTRVDAIRALASNPLVLSLAKAEAVYTEMSAALARFLPERLLH
jgi:6-phospho-beta-glucosidase